ncbi:MAG: hypothetical protein DHS20C21_07790 [Gemmatimonadota bacterium]|nr:MAG: hypothetical protein DHS20C21_07790 [Gemmatimonadota bacterium]
MKWNDLAVLDELGFSIYEKKALASVSVLGVADAASLCREGDIPTSKIYRAMEKLAGLGVVEVQPSRPRLWAALAADEVVDRLVDVARRRADHFADESQDLRELLRGVEGKVRGRQAFADLALGVESHGKRHLSRLTAANHRILSYLEQGDLDAFDRLEADGFRVLRRISRHVSDHDVEHRVVFGFTRQTAGALNDFLRRHVAELGHVTGVRYSGELGHPFHVIDDDIVILSLDHPFVPERRFASLLIRDAELASKLVAGFEELFTRAMRDLREIRFHP